MFLSFFENVKFEKSQLKHYRACEGLTDKFSLSKTVYESKTTESKSINNLGILVKIIGKK